ncbi:HNH endonuclease [Halomonas litopenaei]|uniref:HNH endonuclease n=1 Tax=Halomonas litopenaei TaxID=2109328 RepID=UPI001A8D244F|nr:HNH endonuclease [Halomonas litopenaei]MBN8411128.1 HNH endonuclease [Halomonas litopenaei]
MKKLQRNQEKIESDISEKELEVRRLSSIIEEQNGVIYKLKHLFSSPKINLDDLRCSVSRLQCDIRNLTLDLSNAREALSSIYDYFLSYPPDWDERRQVLIDINGRACSHCGTRSNLHVHHVKPLSKGGSNELSNLIILCEKCHSGVHGGRDFSGKF